jgi:hypothetical protein
MRLRFIIFIIGCCVIASLCGCMDGGGKLKEDKKYVTKEEEEFWVGQARLEKSLDSMKTINMFIDGLSVRLKSEKEISDTYSRNLDTSLAIIKRQQELIEPAKQSLKEYYH